MEQKTFSGIITESHVTEDNKIMTDLIRPRTWEIALDDSWFNCDILKELGEINKSIKDRDKYKGKFKNEN